MEISEAVIVAANKRGEKKRADFPAVSAVRYDRHRSRVVIKLVSGLEVAFQPKHAQGLENATAADLAISEISPSGLGIHFPKLDADIYIPALLAGFLGSKNWMAAEHGRRGGKSSSPGKIVASRENGKLGGRPKKLTSLPTVLDHA